MSELEQLCDELKIKAECRYGAVEVPEGWAPGAQPYKVTLHFQGRRMTVPFFQGSAHTKEPSAADVLYCLASDARSADLTFEEWCGEFGYDVDSRKAENTWKLCVAIAPRLRRLLRDAYERVELAEH